MKATNGGRYYYLYSWLSHERPNILAEVHLVITPLTAVFVFAVTMFTTRFHGLTKKCLAKSAENIFPATDFYYHVCLKARFIAFLPFKYK